MNTWPWDHPQVVQKDKLPAAPISDKKGLSAERPCVMFSEFPPLGWNFQHLPVLPAPDRDGVLRACSVNRRSHSCVFGSPDIP
jgi:hypothetical protein